MTLWLFSQVRTLSVLAGFALILGAPAVASAEKAAPTAVKSSPQGKSSKKGKRTAQVSKKSDKGKTTSDKKSNSGKSTKKATDKKAAEKKPAEKKHRGKTAQSHSQATRRPQVELDRGSDKEICIRNPVEISRLSGEGLSFPLTHCKGKPAEKAVERLSVMMRPYSAAKPLSLPDLTTVKSKGLREGEIAPDVHVADSGLLSRLQAIAGEFPGRRITLVSGYRPGGNGAAHRHGKAIDLRVEGVKTETLATFCRSLMDTGCGYYPNSGFIHIDVRPKGTGHVYWIDAAAPGEPSQPVSSWPLRKEEEEKSKPEKSAPGDDTSHAEVKKKAGHGIATADRGREDDD